MKQTTQKKISYYLVLGLVSLIILGFLFTGYGPTGGQMTGSSQIGEVAGIPVTAREYQNVYNQQMQFYTQFTGGKPLSRKQLEQFGVEKRVQEILVDQKLMIKLAKDLGIKVSEEELAAYIKDLPYFKVEEKFDVNLYRNILARNRLNTQEFEEDIANSILTQNIRGSIFNTPVSTNYSETVFELKNSGVETHIVKFRDTNLKNKIKVSDKEAKNFANDEKNKSILENLYNKNISKYKAGEQVKAQHILIQTNESRDEAAAKKLIEEIHAKAKPENFSDLAKKHTEDTSGKNNGGDLGWFARGKMVKPFEEKAFTMKKGEISNPVKTRFGYHIIYLNDKKGGEQTPFESVKVSLAKEHLQNNSTEKLNEISQDLSEKLTNALKANNVKTVEKLQKEYGLNFQKNIKIDNYNLAGAGSNFEVDELSKIKDSDVSNFKKAGETVIVRKIKTFSPNDLKDKDKKMDEELTTIQSTTGSQYAQKILKNMKESLSVSFN